ncbi:hypothetical protein RHMOL_Rhmol01G0147200 [Rhododendron molle]|nr:hypothetical protein RHMOL_Rhmol01G0147200 [Rhododendron molle]
MLTICEDSGICPLNADGASILGIMHSEEDVDFRGFSFDTSGLALAINVDDDFIISFVALDIMRRMSYMPGLGLGNNQQGVPEFPTLPPSEGRFGLGYVPPAKHAKKGKGTGKPQTLYGDPGSYFMCEAGNCGQHAL